ncbi:rab11 family-interacting protein 3 [Oryx dammah]|uniref:rab11 family-interacting protein 3 n=1 Tax=Oryx dammah TaxID=59534 RepID=UPI001A9AD1CE|nr:rab11 family-interacting protein 3 [Oryx dammah]
MAVNPGSAAVACAQGLAGCSSEHGDGHVQSDSSGNLLTWPLQVTDLTRYLDPSGLGVISFEDFYRGIEAIRNGDPDGPLCGVRPAPDEELPACPEEFDDFVTFEANEVTDSAYMGSESTYSECETFTDEDTGTLVPPECLDAAEEPGHSALLLLPGRSHLQGQSVVTVIGGEEHFEDYGEGSEAELSPETLCGGDHGCRDPAFLTPSADPLSTKLHSILTDEAFEFYCSQCHRQINRLEDLSARLNDLEKNSPTKRLSSKKVARHLQQSGALTMEALQDSPPGPVEGMDEDIADKVVFLEKRVSELEKDTAANGEQHSRLRQENLQLVHRANALEEQLKEQELRACEMLQQLDEENSELRSCTPCLKANIERLEEEKQKLLDEIEELSVRLSDEQENRRKLGDRLSHERHQFQRDKEATQELIEDLRKQLEHLQLFKLEAEQRRGRSSSAGLQEYHSRTRESELEQEVRRLKQDNRSLKEQNDELNGQIINLSIQGARSLFSTAFSESLAAEISSVSRDELMDAIQKQEEINFRLQDYIDRIIVAIMETNPSILEVKGLSTALLVPAANTEAPTLACRGPSPLHTSRGNLAPVFPRGPCLLRLHTPPRKPGSRSSALSVPSPHCGLPVLRGRQSSGGPGVLVPPLAEENPDLGHTMRPGHPPSGAALVGPAKLERRTVKLLRGPEPDLQPQPGTSPHGNRKRRDRAAEARLATRQRGPPPPSAPAGRTAGDVGGRQIEAATGRRPGISLPACFARRPGLRLPACPARRPGLRLRPAPRTALPCGSGSSGARFTVPRAPRARRSHGAPAGRYATEAAQGAARAGQGRCARRLRHSEREAVGAARRRQRARPPSENKLRAGRRGRASRASGTEEAPRVCGGESRHPGQAGAGGAAWTPRRPWQTGGASWALAGRGRAGDAAGEGSRQDLGRRAAGDQPRVCRRGRRPQSLLPLSALTSGQCPGRGGVRGSVRAGPVEWGSKRVLSARWPPTTLPSPVLFLLALERTEKLPMVAPRVSAGLPAHPAARRRGTLLILVRAALCDQMALTGLALGPP